MRTAVVTGVTSDMGRALETLLQKQGWQVIGISHQQLDLSDLGRVEAYGDSLAKRVNSVDALIHFAGVWHDDKEALAGKQLEHFGSRQISNTINVGLTSLMLLSAALLPRMSDNAAAVGISGTFSDGSAGWLPYYVSKRGQEDFLQGLAQDYPAKLRVYGVSPADTATAPYKRFYPEDAAHAQSPETVAAFIAKLIDGETKYASGDIIVLRDGVDSLGYHK